MKHFYEGVDAKHKNVSTDLQTSQSKSMKKTPQWAQWHHMTDPEVVIPCFGPLYQWNSAFQPDIKIFKYFHGYAVRGEQKTKNSI